MEVAFGRKALKREKEKGTHTKREYFLSEVKADSKPLKRVLALQEDDTKRKREGDPLSTICAVWASWKNLTRLNSMLVVMVLSKNA